MLHQLLENFYRTLLNLDCSLVVLHWVRFVRVKSVTSIVHLDFGLSRYFFYQRGFREAEPRGLDVALILASVKHIRYLVVWIVHL